MVSSIAASQNQNSSLRQSLTSKAERLTTLNARVADLSDEELQEILSLRREIKEGLASCASAVGTLCSSLEKALDKGWALQSVLKELQGTKPDPDRWDPVLSELDREVFKQLVEATRRWIEEMPTPPPELQSPETEETPPLRPEGAEPEDLPPEAREELEVAEQGPAPAESTMGEEQATPGSMPQEEQPTPAREGEEEEPTAPESLEAQETPSQSQPKVPVAELPVSASSTEVHPTDVQAPALAPSTEEVSPPSDQAPPPEQAEVPTGHGGEQVALEAAVETMPPPEEDLLGQVYATLSDWLGSWSELPKAYLLVTWLSGSYSTAAKTYPSPALCEVAYYAFRPGDRGNDWDSPSLDGLRQALDQPVTVELQAAAWQLAASLILLHGEEHALELLEWRDWTSRPELEAWQRMTEAVLTYTRQTTDSVLEAARHVRAKAAPSDPKQAREEAQKALAALTRPARFDFLKGQRLTSYIDREFAWLGRKLAQGEVDDKVKDWAKGFKPERALDRWSREVDPRPIPIVGPARQAILRDLRALQSHTSRWVKLKSSAEELQARRDPVAFAFEQLSQTVLEEGDGWRRAWEEQRFACPTLVGWSILMLQQLEEAMQPQAGKEQ